MVTSAPRSVRGSSYAAVLFDLDGTLIDSIAAVERSWGAWAREFGVDPRGLLEFHGVPARGVIASMLPDADDAAIDAAYRWIEDRESTDVDGIVALPGANEALSSILDAGGRCAIVTSGTTPLAWARIAATGLRAPEVVVTASEITRGKPAPDPYLRAAELLGVDPGDCLVVEDAVAGLRSGRAAGAAGLLAVTGSTPTAQLTEYADLAIGQLDEVAFGVGSTGRVAVA